MKKFLLFIALCVTTLTAGAQTTRTLTFDEPSSYWNNLIDSPQYGGSLLYGSTIYSWSDANNTMLCSSIPLNYGEHKYWGGGEAISDYWLADASQGDYTNQLSVYVNNPNLSPSSGRGFHGYDGSKNFAVHYGYKDNSPWNKTINLSGIWFMDEKARTIESMYVNNTAYFVHSVTFGDTISNVLGANQYVKAVAIGHHEDGTTDEVKLILAEGPNTIVTDWTHWDLTDLGEVTRIDFNFDSNVTNSYGMSAPAYFCYDNISVYDEDWGTPNKVKAVETRANDSDTKKLIITINNKKYNEPDSWMSGDVPEGCSIDFEKVGYAKTPTALGEGQSNKLTLKGLPANARITEVIMNCMCDNVSGIVNSEAKIGEDQLYYFEWGGSQANHGYVNHANGTAEDVIIPLNEIVPLINGNDVVFTNESFTSSTSIKGYTISYVLEDADDEPAVATFEDFALEPESYWAGDEDGDEWYYGLGYTQRFRSGAFTFVNNCIPDYLTWIGYAVSNLTSTEFATTDDQFKSCVGSGVNGSANYCVAYPDGTMWGEDLTIEVEGGARTVPGFYITNSAYVVNSILNGDGFAGDPFTTGDYFKVTIHALDADGEETASRDFCLADYRFDSEADRYYINDWQYVDLSQLGDAAAFKFTFDGSRANAYGLLTPTYFCIDDFGAEGEENVREEGVATGIASLNFETRPIGIFTIDGRRVQKANKPGLYIINGKKMMVK